MIKILDPSDCCGCTACATICPYDAISMKPDRLGFLYPNVNKDKCVNCGLCEKVCAFKDDYDKSHLLETPIAYAVRHKDETEVLKSRSGAAFVAISDYILEQGGVVYGAGFEDHFRVVHKRAVNKTDRDELRGSKYVQSDLTDVFKQVKKDLVDGKSVVFSGTPCQTSGLKSYIGKRLSNNLILVDIVCHGVPSPYIWRDYLAYVESKHNSSIDIVNFRDKKEFGWKAHKETFKLKNGEFVIDNMYTELFYKNIMFRHSCGNCHFTNLKRPSDISLADFWGWEQSVPKMNLDDKGISLVFVNTEKGKNLFETIKDRTYYDEVDLEKCVQSRLQYPAIPHQLRMTFEKDYDCYGFKYIFNKYVNPNRFRRLLNYIMYGKRLL